jgi:hypothetical protein
LDFEVFNDAEHDENLKPRKFVRTSASIYGRICEVLMDAHLKCSGMVCND